MGRNLKKQLTSIKENDFLLPGGEYDAFFLKHLGLLGHPDPVIRDVLVYEIFDAWISRGLITRKTLRAVIATMISGSSMFFRIGSTAVRDSVRRTFSLLMVASILQLDNREPFLSEDEVAAVFARIGQYIREERVKIGWDPRVGWSDSICHTADVLKELFRSRHATEIRRDEISGLAAAIIEGDAGIFQYREEERLCAVFFDAPEGVGEPFILQHLREVLESRQPEGYAARLAQNRNITHYLQAVYFHALRRGMMSVASECVEHIYQRAHFRVTSDG